VYLRPLRSGANVLFRHPPHVPSAERAAPGAALDGLGERTSPRPLTFPLPLPVEERKGAKGKVRGIIPPFAPRGRAEWGQGEGEGASSPLPLPVEERNGAKGKVRGHHPPCRSRSAGEEGGWGEGEGHQACAAALAL